ncbi:hypothetical protein [Bordetella petrii]|uniref:hypothetical protein n=1 Tax=Bordetella petrii TaxID=94624 RepID=UPI001E502E1C|nr:hypothetical protein [Bordetella petrii]MCD0502433.1 hypothetical protein [Bordetella petrii]
MKRRTFITSGATAVAALSTQPVLSQSPPVPGQPLSPVELESAAARLRKQFSKTFEPAYVENVIVPYFLVSVYNGERPTLPMIDLSLTKENALPNDLWGLLSPTWRPAPQDGVTVFLQGLEKRGPDNLRKRIYMSAITPDLYDKMYGPKVRAFFDALLAPGNAGKPLMRPYLENYWDLYWDLHLGVKNEGIPDRVREIGEAFNTVLAYRDPTQHIVYENYMTVRTHLDFLKGWIDEKLAEIGSGKIPNPEQTFAWYWIKNGEESEHFSHKDVVFECFHNFVAFSQWGNTLYNIMVKLSRDAGDADTRAWFKKTMEGNGAGAKDAAFPPLERFVMELFRTISPNGGSISALEENRPPRFERHGYIVSPHTSTSMDPVQWRDPQAFDPSRYEQAPTSDRVDLAHVEKMGLAACPFDRSAFAVKDGRKVEMQNSGFGTVFGVSDGKAMPVCDHAGFAPFGFGYRRCPGEQLTIHAIEDFLRKVWKDKIEFVKLDIANPEPLPIGPTTVIGDNVGFQRPA